MPGTTTAAIAIMAANNAQIAANNARRIEEAERLCATWMPSYQHAGATVEQARAYAECVNLVYPRPVDPSGHMALTVAVWLAILSIPVGGVLGWKWGEQEIIEAALGMAVALCAVLCLEGFAALVWWGVRLIAA